MGEAEHNVQILFLLFHCGCFSYSSGHSNWQMALTFLLRERTVKASYRKPSAWSLPGFKSQLKLSRKFHLSAMQLPYSGKSTPLIFLLPGFFKKTWGLNLVFTVYSCPGEGFQTPTTCQ